MPTFSLLTGPTVTTLGAYEVSEGCERKKGQRWGSLERRGMQAMEGEFPGEGGRKGFPSPYSPVPFHPPSVPDPGALSQDKALPSLHLRPLLPSGRAPGLPWAQALMEV